MGVEFVVDYPKNQVGEQGHYEDLLLIDGNWFVNWIPADLINGSKDLATHRDAVDAAKDAIFDVNEKGKKTTLKEKRKAKKT